MSEFSYASDSQTVANMLKEMRDREIRKEQHKESVSELELSLGTPIGASLIKSALTDPTKAYLKNVITSKVPENFRNTAKGVLNDIESGENPVPNLVRNATNDISQGVTRTVARARAAAEDVRTGFNSNISTGRSIARNPFSGSAEEQARMIREQAFDRDPEVSSVHMEAESDIHPHDVFSGDTTTYNESFGTELSDVGNVAKTAAKDASDSILKTSGEDIAEGLAEEAPELAGINEALDSIPGVGEVVAGLSGVAVLGTTLYEGLRGLFGHHPHHPAPQNLVHISQMTPFNT